MKISSFDNSKPLTPASTASAGQPAAAAAADKVAPAAEASAKVALSPAAAGQMAESSADFDAAKVARIAQAIRDGQFSIDAGKIADGLLAHNRGLLSGSPH